MKFSEIRLGLAEVGRLLVDKKNGHKIFVRHVATILATNALFLRVSESCKLIQYNICNSALLANKTLFLTQKNTFLLQVFQKVRKP